MLTDVEIRHFHLFCGIGGGARGFNRGEAKIGTLRARFRCLGGVDVDPAAVLDFGRMAGIPGTLLDLFNRDQYTAFHGHEPSRDWREALPDDIRRAAGGERPHIVFLSAPCKGFSGLLAEQASRGGKYQALNALTLRGVWLMLEAWGDDPPELIVFENVPRITSRGRSLLDRIGALLRHHGYAVAETAHDCGEIGYLAQSRKRFLLVARHVAKVPPFLYEPSKHRLRGVGQILDRLPLPLSGIGGPMHRMPALHWKTWIRLAFVEAGSDWRSLNKLRVEDGVVADYGIVPEREMHRGMLGVCDWAQPAPTITSRGLPNNGGFAVADPRQYGVGGWDRPASTVTTQRSPGQGLFSVADPRILGNPRFNHVYRIVPWGAPAPSVTGANGGTAAAVADPRAASGWRGKGKHSVAPFDGPANTVIAAGSTGHGACAVADPRPGYGEATRKHVTRVTSWNEPGGTVTSAHSPSNGALSVADPRVTDTKARSARLGLLDWNKPSGVVAGESLPSNGAFSVADPRPDFARDGRTDYVTGGHYGVVPYEASSGAVTASGQRDNGRWPVADPRDPGLPAAEERLVCVIRALDDTWHRPFTTLELAALQSLVDPEEHLELDGLSDSAWRERIGNAVPPAAAQAIASVMGRTLLMAWSGQGFVLNAEPIWVQPIAVALSVKPLDWLE